MTEMKKRTWNDSQGTGQDQKHHLKTKLYRRILTVPLPIGADPKCPNTAQHLGGGDLEEQQYTSKTRKQFRFLKPSRSGGLHGAPLLRKKQETILLPFLHLFAGWL